MGLYKYTFNNLNNGLGLIGKRLSKIINEIHKVLNAYKIKFHHHAYYGDFEAYSSEICKRVKSPEQIFTKKLIESSEKMKKEIKNIYKVDLLVKSLSNKQDWIKLNKKNEKKINQKLKMDKSFKRTILFILQSRMDLYKNWYPNLKEKEYLSLLIKQGAEYASMGDIFFKKFKCPVVFGLDHPKMGIFYNINSNFPVFYGKPKYI